MALDHGAQGTPSLQALYHTLTRPSFGEKPCSFCDNQSTEQSHFEHFITCHTPFASPEFIVELLVRESTDSFVHMPSIFCILYPCDPCCIHYAMPRWLLMHLMTKLSSRLSFPGKLWLCLERGQTQPLLCWK